MDSDRLGQLIIMMGILPSKFRSIENLSWPSPPTQIGVKAQTSLLDQNGLRWGGSRERPCSK
jgi:hypothetical protein